MELLEQQRECSSGPRPWILSSSSADCGIFFEHLVAALEAAALLDLLKHGGDAFADAGNIGDLALGIFEDRRDRFGMSFDHARGVAIAADAKGILAGDLHQVGGFIQQAERWRDFPLTA